VINNNRMRGEIDTALAALKLFSKDDKVRAAAIKVLQGEADESAAADRKSLAAETTRRSRPSWAGARRGAAGQRRQGQTPGGRTAAGGQRRPQHQDRAAGAHPKNPTAEVKSALEASLARWRNQLAWGDRLGAMFSGISLGSILLLVALGLAITYGLMGVINMAHGELMMIGAYATYVVQGLFQKYLPGAFDWYLVAAVPVAFMASALMGAAAGAQRDPLPVRPPAGDAAGHLGHQPHAHAAGAHRVWRAERGRGKPELDERRRGRSWATCSCPGTASSSSALRSRCCWAWPG
jgi:urea transport system permease protein